MSSICATTLLAAFWVLTGNAAFARTACASWLTGAAAALVARCALASCASSAFRAEFSDDTTAGPAWASPACTCSAANEALPTVWSRSFSRSCASRVTCLPRSASWAVRV